MDIRQLRYFVAVVEEGTISAAARKLHISQPPLSYQIQELESEYGVKLFDRGARQITLTDAGNLLYRYAQEILELEQAADNDLKNIHLGKTGSVRLGLISSADSEELYTGLKVFHQEYSDVQFKIFEGNTYELLEQLRKGKIELAVVRTPFPRHNLDCITLTKDTMVLTGTDTLMHSCLPASILEQTEILLKDVQLCPLIIYRRWEKIVRDAFEKENAHPDILCINDDARTSLEWAAAGLGLAIVPASIMSLMPQLPHLQLAEEEMHSSICLVKLRTGQVPARELPVSQVSQALFEIFQNKAAKAVNLPR